MTLNLDAVGRTFGPFDHRYDFRDRALYALSVGAGVDDLAYLVEGDDAKVLPTYGVVPSVEPIFAALRELRVDERQMLHMQHRLDLIEPLPIRATLSTRVNVAAVWDMVMGALVHLVAESEFDGRPVLRNSWHVLVRGAGRFGGDRPPPFPRGRIPRDRPPDFETSVRTRPEQALLYRLNGDLNPVHARPDAAREAGFDRPILHGLCTYGILGRVALAALAEDRPARFRALEARFSKAVMPSDTLIVRGYRLENPGRAALTVTVAESGQEAIEDALFEFEP